MLALPLLSVAGYALDGTSKVIFVSVIRRTSAGSALTTPAVVLAPLVAIGTGFFAIALHELYWNCTAGTLPGTNTLVVVPATVPTSLLPPPLRPTLLLSVMVGAALAGPAAPVRTRVVAAADARPARADRRSLRWDMGTPSFVRPGRGGAGPPLRQRNEPIAPGSGRTGKRPAAAEPSAGCHSF
ncbi:hypothetical protein Ate01nite_30670 [Actinoplanes teichomyceticus]|nr:hypothetical protein Ate01nite_30670 [Actinoplanes teichomyceticus]